MAGSESVLQREVGALYSDHHGWLRSWLRRKLQCPEQAADVAHDTFCRLLGLPRTEFREPRAFLVTTATRLLIDRSRRAQIERAYLDTWAAIHADANAASPEQQQEAIDTLLAIAALLEGLPRKAREAFLMSRLEELSQSEIAAQLDVSVSMIKQYMAQAMRHCYAVLHGMPEQ
ncbi:MAG TPA: sigma-70 family RNA polymerase sigma factor [Povalibacter sp.]|uniref:sigma-70 family RNA polymerase sigma factor n=1 Tax=Povalibacter sp. TaxID=1962978 RepID=UPI002BBCB119|nr:sigma-70 family RNA polymerase sigma factor [Povalibacter sp.]HMN43771.1 sigma-70 family RNA polymerase sigma factor [Povalibacter sp.]